MTIIIQVLFTGLLIQCRLADGASRLHPDARKAIIFNYFLSPMAVYWKNSDTNKTAFIFDVNEGDSMILDTYVGHEFEVKANAIHHHSSAIELSSVCNSEGNEAVCRQSNDAPITASFVIQKISRLKRSTLKMTTPWRIALQGQSHDYIVVDEEPTPSDLARDGSSRNEPQVAPMTSCRQIAEGSLTSLYDDGSSPTPSTALNALSGFTDCLAQNLTYTLQHVNDVDKKEEKMRRALASQLEGYTCADKNFSTTAPMYTTTWTQERTSETRDVRRECCPGSIAK
jgi:hypothetical protein